MAFESIEVRGPQLPVRLQPVVELGKWLGTDAVQPALRVGAYVDEPGVLQHAQVLRHRGLAETQALHEIADRPLSVAQELEDLQPAGLPERLEQAGRRHRPTITTRLYICQAIYGRDALASLRCYAKRSPRPRTASTAP